MSQMDIGRDEYAAESPVWRLVQLYGDRLERLSRNDKLGLTAAISLRLSINHVEDLHWSSPNIAHTNLFPSSSYFSKAAVEIEDISHDEALSLLAALVAQISGGVYAPSLYPQENAL